MEGGSTSSSSDGWTRDQIKHGLNVMEHLLADFPGSAYGDDKSPIASAMADRKATMVFFNTEEELNEAMRSGLARATDLSMQDLRANECPAPGDADYMAHVTRDASYEEIWHLIHDYGDQVPTLPEMIAEMRAANDVAEANGWRGLARRRAAGAPERVRRRADRQLLRPVDGAADHVRGSRHRTRRDSRWPVALRACTSPGSRSAMLEEKDPLGFDADPRSTCRRT